MFVSLTSQIGAVLMAAVCLYAIVRGRWPERIGGAALALNWVACEALDQWHAPTTTQPYLFAIDTAYDLLLLGLTIKTNRIWAIGALGFQSMIVLVHILTVYDPLLDRLGFFRIYYGLSYGVLAALLIGTHYELRRLPPSRASVR